MIATTRHPMGKGWTFAVTLFGAAMLGSCAAPQVVTPPRVPPAVAVRPVPPPPPLVPAQADWRDVPQTAGNWIWGMLGAHSTASFVNADGDALLRISCNREDGQVLLLRAGTASGPVPMAVRTTSTLRPLTSDPLPAAPGWLAAPIPVRDPLLDAIAFSRGRFAVEAPGLDTLYLPAWPEISRVIEDCR